MKLAILASSVRTARVGSGVMAGVQLAVAISVLPTLERLPEKEAAHMHAMLGRRYDPTMPIVGVATIAASAIASLAGTGSTRLLLAMSAIAMTGVSGISHLGNVPVNKKIRARDGGEQFPSWTDPRPYWRKLHMARTTLACACLILTAIAGPIRVDQGV